MRVQLLLAGIIVLAGCNGGPAVDEPGTGVVIKDVYTDRPTVEASTPNGGNETDRTGTPPTTPHSPSQADPSEDGAEGDDGREVDGDERQEEEDEERADDDGDESDDQERSDGVGGIVDDLVSQLEGSGDAEDDE